MHKSICLLLTCCLLVINAGGQDNCNPVSDLLIEPLEYIEIQGKEILVNQPPLGFISKPDLGVMMHHNMKAKRLHAWAPPFNASFHPRAVITPGGDYLVVFSAGRGHMWHDKRQSEKYHEQPNDLMIYRSSDMGATWHGPYLPFKVPYGHNTSVPFVPENGKRIYLFSTEVNPEWGGWPDGGIAMRYSDDDGYTWSKAKRIEPINSPGYRGQAHMQMTETEKGTWLLGTYHTGSLTRPGGREDRQYVLRSTDRGESWTLLPDKEPKGWFIPEYNYMIEGRLLSLKCGEVLFWGRAPGGNAWESQSSDDGLSWTDFKPVHLVHPDAPPMIWKLADDKTLISIFHNRYDPDNPRHDHNQRSELWFALSKDDAKTWSEPRFLMANIAEKGGPLDSPSISYDDLLVDGENLHLFVDWQFRQVLHFQFSESDLNTFPTEAELIQSIDLIHE